MSSSDPRFAQLISRTIGYNQYKLQGDDCHKWVQRRIWENNRHSLNKLVFYGDMRGIIKLVFNYCFISHCSKYEPQKTTVYCLPKMINLINKEKIWFLKTLRLRFRNHAWFKKKKKNEETSNQIMLYTHYTLKKLNLKIKILTAEQVTQFCENKNYSLSVKLFCMSVKD